MKKSIRSIAALVAGLVTAATMFTFSATAATAITVDGDVNEWSNAWTAVNGNTGVYQAPLEEGATRNDSYSFQYATDGSNLYLAIITDYAPVGTADAFGNGKGTNIRIWTAVMGAKFNGATYTTYNNFVNVAYKAGETVVSYYVNQYTPEKVNSALALEQFGAKAATKVTNGKWVAEISIPFADMGAVNGSDLQFYVTVSTPTEAGGADNNALFFGKIPYGEETKLANFPYSSWYSETALKADTAIPAEESSEAPAESSEAPAESSAVEESSEAPAESSAAEESSAAPVESSTAPAESSAAASSTAPVTPSTADAGIVALAVMAVLAGAGAVVVKKAR